MIVLNIGCGVKTTSAPEVAHLDWSIYLIVKRNLLLRWLIWPFLSAQRRAALESLPETIRAYDLRKGLPYADNSVDAAYHSHFLEHLDREAGACFSARNAPRAAAGGVHRIVVPDWEALCRQYLQSLDACLSQPEDISTHESKIAEMLEQSVRREPAGTSRQRPMLRWLENRLLGDARKRGETHQWAYDRVSLQALLKDVGFSQTRVVSYAESQIPHWNDWGLDRNAEGGEYKPGSLYIEAIK